MNTLRWMRMFGDTIFAFGALVLGWFVLGLVTGHSFDKTAVLDEGEYVARELELSALGRLKTLTPPREPAQAKWSGRVFPVEARSDAHALNRHSQPALLIPPLVGGIRVAL